MRSIDSLLKIFKRRHALCAVFLLSAVLLTSSTFFVDSAEAAAKKPDNRIIIKKINVDAPIVEGTNPKKALMKGMWRMPDTSTPDKGGNTVITGHRWLYKYPNKMTFWALNKVKKGDEIIVKWSGVTYRYKVFETKIVNQYAVSILDPTKEPVLTVFTCDPIYVGTNRLVVLARPVTTVENSATSTPKVN